ncbi:MAG: hypothetical protein K2N01_06235, partial [Lachnospiraceae bacterium]|nr:hypothetical protein [Lachnospiraceae bacterium]
MQEASVAAQNMAASANGLTVDLSQIPKVSRAGQVALKAFAAAANMLVFALISKGIQAAMDAIDRYIHRAEYAAQAMKEAQQKISESQSNLRSMSATLAENKDRFLELSNGVDKFSRNLSLSTEDYAEYLSISNELAELFPTLISGYDNQGNALLAIGSDAEETRKKLQELIEAEQDAARQTLIDGMDDLARNVYYEADDAKDSIQGMKSELAELQEQYKELSVNLNNSTGRVSFSGFGSDDADKYTKILEEALTTAGIAYKKQYGDIWLEYASPDQYKEARKIFKASVESDKAFLAASIRSFEQGIQAEEDSVKISYSKMNASLQAWVADNANYQYLSDQSSAMVDALIPGINWDGLENPPMTADDYQNYIQENILDPLMKVPQEHRKEVDEMFRQLLSYEDGDMDVLSFAETVQKRLNELNLNINIAPAIADAQQAKDNLQSSIDRIAEGGNADFTTSSGVWVDAGDYKTLTEYTADFNAAQIACWNDATLGAENAEEAIERYEAALKTVSKNAHLSFADSLSRVNSLSDGLDQLGKIYADIQDSGDFDWSSILNNEDFKDTFGGFTEEYDHFIQTVASHPNDIGACQSAFNDLASAYIYNSDALKDLTDETKGSAIAMLEQMGVTNAEEIVTEQLTAQTEALALKEQALALTKDGVTAATADSINALLNEANASETARAYLFKLIADEQVFNNQGLNVQGKISALGELASAYGQTAVAAKIAAWEQAAKDSHVQSSLSQADIKHLQEEIAASINTPIQFKSTSFTRSTSAATQAAQETTETFNWLETLLSRIQRKITNFGKTVSAVWQSWSKRNNAAIQQLAAIREELTTQQQAYDAYLAKADSVGLSGHYQDLVKNGSIRIEDITDDGLKEQIKAFQDWYEKALAASDAIADLKDNLADLAKTRFDNVSKQFEQQLSLIEHEADLTNNRLEQAEAKGYLVSGSYYEFLIALEEDTLAQLKRQHAALGSTLQTSVADGTVELYSEQWYDMVSDIQKVEKDIGDAELSIINHNNKLRELDWDLFDRSQEQMAQIPKEADFLLSLMEHSDLYDESGSLNRLGNAAAGLHAVSL